MSRIRSLFLSGARRSVSCALALAFSPLAALASDAVSFAPPEVPTSELTALSSQYVQEIALDMCNWSNRPTNSTCTAQNAADAPSTWNRANAVACAAPTAPAPSTSWFDLSPTVACPYDGINGCRTQQWHWPDGRYLSGWGWSVIHCPSNPVDWSTGLFTKPLATTVSNHVFLRVPGFLSHSQPRTVRGQVKVMLYTSKPYSPSGLPSVSLSATLALQTQGTDNVWRDIAIRVLPAPPYGPGTFYEMFELEAVVQPYTPVRVELRANTLPALRVADENNIWMNYHLNADLIEARLILPDCIPDQSRPGFCL
ncbi:hypothetical protein MYSTI_01313 [Myxococcus stipitatus DSM 14675]|uniref:Uncharacterized protein n=1 Tax=Myxococcus stipitatus (strain DSM 14675 / JCM 12634 / Mx s8) TaxID=1278073 RepID=L7U1J3_MYXSD|nr:hypothetical protein [Myxococcus stipitatus]AGC42661.1 hypothetical protein MYSTI_01313 [Myxococcus stipitatus DSM 14675]